MRVIAIDPGTSCGYAYTDTGTVCVEQSGVLDLKPRRHEGGGMRCVRMKSLLWALASTFPAGDVGALFYEEVRGHRGTDAAHIYGGIIAVIAAFCEERSIPYRGIPVGTIKKRATGKGNASKAQMIESAQERWGDTIKSDDQADALWLLQVGLEELGMGAP